MDCISSLKKTKMFGFIKLLSDKNWKMGEKVRWCPGIARFKPPTAHQILLASKLLNTVQCHRWQNLIFQPILCFNLNSPSSLLIAKRRLIYWVEDCLDDRFMETSKWDDFEKHSAKDVFQSASHQWRTIFEAKLIPEKLNNRSSWRCNLKFKNFGATDTTIRIMTFHNLWWRSFSLSLSFYWKSKLLLIKVRILIPKKKKWFGMFY